MFCNSVIFPSGFVGIGTTNPIQTLTGVGSAGKSSGGTAWVDNSDSRLKNELGNITNALSLVEKLRPIKYEWNDTRKKLMGEDPGVKFRFVV